MMRHDAAHLMAEAVKELYPDTQVTIGPAIENGFYYDFARRPALHARRSGQDRGAHAGDRRPRREDHPRGMGARRCRASSSTTWARHYKAEIIAGFPPTSRSASTARAISSISAAARICPSTGKLGTAFKLTQAWPAPIGAAIRATPCSNASTARPGRREGAQSLSHPARRGREARPSPPRQRDGSVPSPGRSGRLGVLASEWLDALSHDRKLSSAAGSKPAGYVEVRTPQLVDRSLWEASGHWDKFRDNMFKVKDEEAIACSASSR